MNIKKILTAAAAVAVLSVTGVSTASADSWGSHGGYGYHDSRFDSRFGRDHRRHAERRVVFETLRFHHIRYVGDPYFVRGHYVVRTFDRFGRVAFVEINPFTGGLIGYIRL